MACAREQELEVRRLSLDSLLNDRDGFLVAIEILQEDVKLAQRFGVIREIRCHLAELGLGLVEAASLMQSARIIEPARRCRRVDHDRALVCLNAAFPVFKAPASI